MKTLYFIRHGEYNNPLKVLPLRMPGFPLSLKGNKQARMMAEYFKDKNIKKVYSSPIERTSETAEIICKKINIKFFTNSSLSDVISPYQGVKKKDFFRIIKSTVYEDPYHISVGGEGIIEVFERVNKFIEQVLVNDLATNIVIISHGDPIMIYLWKKLALRKDYIQFCKDFIYIEEGELIEVFYGDDNNIQSITKIQLSKKR